MRKFAFVVPLVFAAVLASLVSSFSPLARRHPPQPEGVPAIRVSPIVAVARPVAMNQSVGDSELRRIIEVVRPRFTMRRVPLSLLYHCLRVFGERGVLEVAVRRGDDETWMAGPRFIDILTNHNLFNDYVSFSLRELHARSAWGVRTASAADFSEASRRGSAHVGKFHDTMAKINLPSDYPLLLADNSRSDIASCVRDEAMRYHPDVEPEWVAQALCSYLASPSWRNRFRRQVDLDSVIVRLLDRPLGRGSCHGIHVLQALAWAVGVHRRSAFLSAETEARIVARLRRWQGTLSAYKMRKVAGR